MMFDNFFECMHVNDIIDAPPCKILTYITLTCGVSYREVRVHIIYSQSSLKDTRYYR